MYTDGYPCREYEQTYCEMSKEHKDEVKRQLRGYQFSKEPREYSKEQLAETRRLIQETRKRLLVAQVGQEGYDEMIAKRKKQ